MKKQLHASMAPSNERMQQTKRWMERVPAPLGVINVRFAADPRCSADLTR